MPPDPPLPSVQPFDRQLESLEAAMYVDFYQALPGALAAELGVEAHCEGKALRLTARKFDHPFFNRIMGVGLDTPAEVWIEKARNHYGSLGIRRWMLQVAPHGESEVFRSTCQARGLIRLRGWAKHVGPATLAPSAHTDLRILRIGMGEDHPNVPSPPPSDPGPPKAEWIDAWAAIVTEAFAMPKAFRPWLSGLAGRTGWHLYLALDGDTPVGTAALYAPTDPGRSAGDGAPVARIGHLTFAGTLPRYRGRGVQSALVARRFQDARALGLDWIVTETDEELPDRPNPSYRNMIRLGLPARYVRGNWGPPKPSR